MTGEQTIKQLNNDFRQAQSLMFNGKKEESAAMVKAMLLMTGNALRENPSDAGLLQIRDKISKLKGDLIRRGANFDDPPEKKANATVNEPASAEPQPISHSENAPPENTTGSKLPQAVERRLQIIATAIRKKDIALAEQSMKEIINGYKGQFDETHPLFRQISGEYERFVSDRNEITGAAKVPAGSGKADEESSLVWLHKLNRLPFVLTPSPELAIIRQKLAEAEQVKNALSECQSQTFDKADFLVQKENEIQAMLNEFPAIFRDMLDMAAARLSEIVVQKISYLQQNQSRSNAMPLFISDIELGEIRQEIQELEALHSPKPPSVETLTGQWQQLVQSNSAALEIRKQWVRMRPNKYTGTDLNEITGAAQKLTGLRHPDLIILKTAVVSEGWSEESGWKYTDTTQTHSVFETTACLTVELAGKLPPGKTHLFTINIEKKKLIDGNWSPLSGNIMHSEEISEDNI